MAGVSINGKSRSVDTGVNGLALIITETSARNVHRTSWESGLDLTCINMESSILRVIPIMHSQTLPMWEAWGELNSYVLELSLRYFCAAGSFAILLNPSSLLAPTKFVPQSERNCFAGPQIAKNLLSPLIQLEVFIVSTTSIWTARVLMQEKNTA